MNIIYTPRFYPLYPRNPVPSSQCLVNQEYQTLPETWPRRREIAGPASVAKKLYPSEPNCYGYLYRDIPVGTMYENDLGAVTQVTGQDENGNDLGTYAKRQYYHYQAYPFHNQYARELRLYRGEILPYPTIANWEQYPVTVPGQKIVDWGFQ